MHENNPRESPELTRRKNNGMVKNRLVIVACFFVFAFIAVAFKATEVMVFKPKPQTATASAGKRERMEIIDRNGVIVATNLHTTSIYANPREMIEKKDAAKKLSATLRDVDVKYLEKEFASKKVFTWVKRNITPQEQRAVNELGIPGIYYMQDVARVYPQGKLLSHILGYVDVDNKGLAGVEREFEELLHFSDNGQQLQLSVDVKLQQILHEELAQAITDYRALGGSGIVIDVTNGEVIALISMPDFDPNSPGSATPNEKFNRVTLGTYELGSVLKGFTAAIGLDTGKFKPTSVFDATHSLQIGKRTIHDYHAQKRMLTVTEVLEYSSNVGTARMGLLIGGESLHDYFGRFGLLDIVPIEIPERGKPQVQKKWTDIVTATVSFGHGIAITPAHIARGYQAIVNGGILHPLTLMKKKPDDEIISSRVISQQTSDQMREILRNIVLGGTGRNADAQGYLVAGKTGTADKQVNGKYVGAKVISSFAGAFPINNPKYMIYVVVDEPQEKTRGVRPTAGIVAAPIVKNFVDRAAPLLGMKPQFNTEPPDTYTNIEHDTFATLHD